MRRFVLGTAGHVDHGKTSLVRALTGRETDRLPAEKQRGITIELGFAPWDLGAGIQASLVDVPGHRRLVHAMIAGAGGIELVILVVAANEGVMPQTREHVAVCELLGVRRAVVAVSKIDAADPELAAIAGVEARALLGANWSAEVVPCSARTGEGLGALQAAVRRSLEAAEAAPRRSDPPSARMAVDRVFTVRGAGTVVTGTLVHGQVRVGAPLFVVGERGRRQAHARALQIHDAPVDLAAGPTRLAINLAGVALDEVKRGDVITDDETLRATDLVDVVLTGATAALPRGAAATLHVGTARAAVRVLRVEEGATGQGSAVRLRLAEPIAIGGGDRYVLRGSDVDGPAGAILGGGVVLDSAPGRVRSRTRWRRVLAAVTAGDAEETVRALVEERAPMPLQRASLAGRFAIAESPLACAADLLEGRGLLARIGARSWIAQSALAALALRAREVVAEHVRAFPLDRGMPIETLRAKLARSVGRDAAERAIGLASNGGPAPLAVEGDIARIQTSPLDAELANRLAAARRAVEQAGKHGTGAFAVGEATGAPPGEVRAILARLVRDGAAMQAGDLWFSHSLVEELRALAEAHLKRASKMSVVEFKQISGLARKQAVLLLEHFDRLGLTRREGDVRVLR